MVVLDARCQQRARQRAALDELARIDAELGL